MDNIISLEILQFALIYLLLIITLLVMKKAKIEQTKLLLVASIRMTVQLVLAGFILTAIFKNPHPIFTIAYITVMIAFASHRIISKNPWLNRRFKFYIVLSLGISGIFVLGFFILGIVRTNIFNPQYAIPIGGMIIGNSMTGVSLGIKAFHENINANQDQISTLLNIGVHPKRILLPFANKALETALLPTLNSMLSMGIISLPGMMTGQILSGTLPTTAIMYQIAIMIAVCTGVCLSVFGSLNLGYKTLYNDKSQIDI